MGSRSTGTQRKRVESGPLQTALLDEIAERLLAIQRMTEESRPHGIVEPLEPIRVTDQQRRVVAPFGPWFAVTVMNDGPSDLWAIVNTEKSVERHHVLNGEVYGIDMKRAIIKDVLLQCDPHQTATIRLVGTR